jgi:hypothetical protein
MAGIVHALRRLSVHLVGADDMLNVIAAAMDSLPAEVLATRHGMLGMCSLAEAICTSGADGGGGGGSSSSGAVRACITEALIVNASLVVRHAGSRIASGRTAHPRLIWAARLATLVILRTLPYSITPLPFTASLLLPRDAAAGQRSSRLRQRSSRLRRRSSRLRRRRARLRRRGRRTMSRIRSMLDRLQRSRHYADSVERGAQRARQLLQAVFTEMTSSDEKPSLMLVNVAFRVAKEQLCGILQTTAAVVSGALRNPWLQAALADGRRIKLQMRLIQKHLLRADVKAAVSAATGGSCAPCLPALAAAACCITAVRRVPMPRGAAAVAANASSGTRSGMLWLCSTLLGSLLTGGAGGTPPGSAPPRRLPLLLYAAGCWNIECASSGAGTATEACRACGLARYCCPDCQRQHWRLHKKQCGQWRG